MTPFQRRKVFKDLLKRYPYSKKARNARARLDDLRTQLKQAKKSSSPKPILRKAMMRPLKPWAPRVEQSSEGRPKTVESVESALNQGSPKSTGKTQSPEEVIPKPSLIEVIRYWNTEDYTRLVINTGREVKYIEGRVDNPTRVFIDIQNVRLSPALAGKTVILNDGYVNKIRFGQSQGYRRAGSARYGLDQELPGLANVRAIPHRRRCSGSGEVPSSRRASWLPIQDGRCGMANPWPTNWTCRHLSQKSSATKATEEKIWLRSLQNQLHQGRASSDETGTEKQEAFFGHARQDRGNQTATAREAPREQESKNIARSSVPKSDGTRSLIRTLGLKVGRIVVDPGHGGDDTGTVGPSGLQEKDLVLDIALKLKVLVEEKLGSEVLLTRTDDTFVPLEERTAMANHSQADLFLSIHANSSRNRRVSGVETFFLDFASSSDAEEIAARENSSAQKTIFELQDLVQKIALKEKIEESRELAQIVQQSVASQLRKAHSQTRDRGVKQAPFIVLIGANMPSILSEVSFMSNPSDEKLLKSSSYRQKVAEALCRGIEAYAEALGGIKTARNLP